MSQITVPEGLLHIGEQTFKVYNVKISRESGPYDTGSATFEVEGNGTLPMGLPQVLEVTGPGSLPNRRYSITVFVAHNHTGSRTLISATELTLIP